MCMKDDSADSARREFLAGSVGIAVAGLATSAVAQSQTPGPPPPTRVLDSTDVVHGPVVFSHNGKPSLDGYLARPKAAGRYPPIIVIAGNRITEEYIPNTCAALALAGFVGLAPNLYHIVPDTAQTNAEIAAASAAHDEDDVLEDMIAGMDYLRTQAFVDSRAFGALGFCFGGKMALKLGSRAREIDAVVAFHPGPTVPSADIARLSVPVQIHSGTIDKAVPIEVIRDLEARLKAKRTPVDLHIYEGADHGFLAYTRPQRYNPAAGQLAWKRTISFLKSKLVR